MESVGGEGTGGVLESYWFTCVVEVSELEFVRWEGRESLQVEGRRS